MKRPNRTVSIFSMSALDVLATATGVFVLLLVMLMPYYRMTFDANAEIAEVRVSVAETMAEVRALERQAILYRGEAEGADADADRLDAAAADLEAQARADRGRTPARPEVPRRAEGRLPENLVVAAMDLVVVIDTTASMGPPIRDLSASIRGLIRILERLVPSLRVGIVAYKDRDTGLAPVEVLPITPTDRHLPRILGFVDRLEEARIGSPTVEEDVHLGLAAAFAMPLRPDARQAIVVVGDAAAHRVFQEETLIWTRNFVRANRNRTVSTLFVTTPSSLAHGQRDRRYFQRLAEAGGGSFNDHTGTMTESLLLSVLVE
ncbi:MAG: hypothetical protein ACFCUO_13090 [Rhodospirillales bacterium]